MRFHHPRIVCKSRSPCRDSPARRRRRTLLQRKVRSSKISGAVFLLFAYFPALFECSSNQWIGLWQEGEKSLQQHARFRGARLPKCLFTTVTSMAVNQSIKLSPALKKFFLSFRPGSANSSAMEKVRGGCTAESDELRIMKVKRVASKTVDAGTELLDWEMQEDGQGESVTPYWWSPVFISIPCAFLIQRLDISLKKRSAESQFSWILCHPKKLFGQKWVTL